MTEERKGRIFQTNTEKAMSLTVKLQKRLNKKRRGNIQLIQAAIAIMILIGIGATVFALVMGIGSQITQNTPAPAQGTLFYNLTSVFNKAVGQGVNLLPAVFLVAFGVIVLGAILYIWGWFGGGHIGLGRYVTIGSIRAFVITVYGETIQLLVTVKQLVTQLVTTLFWFVPSVHALPL